MFISVFTSLTSRPSILATTSFPFPFSPSHSAQNGDCEANKAPSTLIQTSFTFNVNVPPSYDTVCGVSASDIFSASPPSVTTFRIWYIQDAIFSSSTLRDVQSLSYVNRDLWSNGQKHILKRLTLPFRHYPFDFPFFLHFLEAHQSVLFGSTVTSVLMPQNGTQTTLDIAVPFYAARIMVTYFQNSMGSLATDISDYYPRSLFCKVYSVGRAESRIKIFVAPTQNALAPVLSAPSTSLMNFISGSHIYCAYPDLTFDHSFMLNIGTLFSDDPLFDIIDFAESIERVEAQGFSLKVNDDFPHAECGTSVHCPSTSRVFKAPYSSSWTFRIAGQPRGDISALEWVARDTSWCLQRELTD
ncbi:hypothetical protein H0H93_008554 [Arthromyces matolae]|nr:hypothetical protein H0H93_008554 [Arthromyces matolae]